MEWSGTAELDCLDIFFEIAAAGLQEDACRELHDHLYKYPKSNPHWRGTIFGRVYKAHRDGILDDDTKHALSHVIAKFADPAVPASVVATVPLPPPPHDTLVQAKPAIDPRVARHLDSHPDAAAADPPASVAATLSAAAKRAAASETSVRAPHAQHPRLKLAGCCVCTAAYATGDVMSFTDYTGLVGKFNMCSHGICFACAVELASTSVSNNFGEPRAVVVKCPICATHQTGLEFFRPPTALNVYGFPTVATQLVPFGGPLFPRQLPAGMEDAVFKGQQNQRELYARLYRWVPYPNGRPPPVIIDDVHVLMELSTSILQEMGTVLYCASVSPF